MEGEKEEIISCINYISHKWRKVVGVITRSTSLSSFCAARASSISMNRLQNFLTAEPRVRGRVPAPERRRPRLCSESHKQHCSSSSSLGGEVEAFF